MKAKSRIILFIFLFQFSHSYISAQASPGTGPRDISYRKSVRIKNMQRREARKKRKLEKEERKAIKKHHKRIQTKQVRKRMKSSKKLALRNNANKKEFFLKRWFKKKSRAKGSTKKINTN